LGIRPSIPAAGSVNGMFVQGDGTHLFSSDDSLLLRVPSAGMLTLVAGNDEGFEDGQSFLAEFNLPTGIAVD